MAKFCTSLRILSIKLEIYLIFKEEIINAMVFSPCHYGGSKFK
jgi:hypothetical protein